MRGPVGADGSAPMLSAFAARSAAVREGVPSFRRPGSSLAAAAEGQGIELEQRRSQGMAGEPPVRHAPPERGGGGDPSPARTAGDAAPRNRWGDQVPPCDGGRDDDGESAYADEDVAWEDLEDDELRHEGGDDAVPGPEALRQLWEQEGRAVKLLEQQGLPDSSPVLAAAREARDRSEQNWRKARKPQPLPIRMGWMQRKLDKAAKALERARLEKEAFEDQVEQRREALQRKVEEAESWYRFREDQMDALHAEAGERVQGWSAESSTGRSAARAEADELRAMFAREMQAFAEFLVEGTEERARANLLLAKLESAEPSVKGPQRYTIGHDWEEGDSSAVDEAQRGMDGAHGDGERARWSADAYGRWNRTRAAERAASRSGRGRGDDGAWDGMDVEVACRTHAGEAVPKGAEKGKGGIAGATSRSPGEVPTSASQKEGDQASGKGRTSGCTRPREGGETPHPKSHRGHDIADRNDLGDEGDDIQRAERLHREQAAAVAAAQEANAVFGDDKSRQIAGQIYAQQVDAARRRAEKVGQPTTVEGKSLIELSPEQLGDWVRATLEPAEAAAREGGNTYG